MMKDIFFLLGLYRIRMTLTSIASSVTVTIISKTVVTPPLHNNKILFIRYTPYHATAGSACNNAKKKEDGWRSTKKK